jgi:hypothetical protein
MKHFFLIFLLFNFLMVSVGCNSAAEKESCEDLISNGESGESFNSEYQDGTYCADVEFYNPSTGTRNTYNLDVEVELGELTLIHWPNNGWLDNTHFSPEDITSGECEFKSDKGYVYTIVLGELGGCGYTDENKIRNDVNAEVTELTCYKCGSEKDRYDDYCDGCRDKIEHTCKRCGQIDQFMFLTDDYCSSCEDKLENTCSQCGGHENGVNGGLCSSCNDEN